jgi:hypothetical protein
MENNNQFASPVPAPVPAGKPGRASFWKGFALGFFLGVFVPVIVLAIFYMSMVSFVMSSLKEANKDAAASAPYNNSRVATSSPSAVTTYGDPVVDERAKNASIKAAMSNLRAYAEIEYDLANSYLSTCTAGSMSTRIAEVKKEALNGEVVCMADADSYAIGATFRETGATKTFCIDSSGSSETLLGKASDLITSANAACR